VTIVLTTHDMDEAATLCDRVGIVDHGKLLALDTPEALTHQLTGRSVLDLSFVPAPADEIGELTAALLEIDGVERWEQVTATTAPVPGQAQGSGFPGADTAFRSGQRGPADAGGAVAAVAVDPTAAVTVRLYLSVEPAVALAPVVGLLASRDAMLTDVHIGAPSLEDVFINLTGRGLR
jgi:ABC-2 type transport system ATP-binding protein